MRRWSNLDSMLPPGPRLPGPVQTALYLSQPLHYLRRWHQQYGEAFTLRMAGAGNMVFISSPQDIKRVFTAPMEVVHAGESNSLLRPFLGPHSVVILDEWDHVRQRRLLLPPFQGERMQAYAKVMREVTHASLVRWPRARPFPLLDVMTEITLELMLRNVFGLETPGEIAAFSRDFSSLVDSTTSPLRMLPSLIGMDLFTLMPWARASRLKKRVDAAIYSLVARRRAEPRRPERTDVLSMLLESTHEDGRPMSDQELRDALLTLIVAGYETSAIGLSFTVERLLAEPRTLARVHEELERVVGDDELGPEHIERLEYLEAAIKEALRVRPLVPLISRQLKGPLELTHYTLSAGVTVLPAIVLTHFREDLYPEPERFKPERFLEQKPDPYAWLPFGGGARRCLGMAFAMYEMKVVLATLLGRAKLRLASSEPVRMINRHIMLAPAGGVPVVLDEVRARRD
ncbi:cytochrome P450 [Archangium minus]|uniref:Cytochrome P450 n=2 Tax=Archangium minus TaxID=83450 RepID=A0ABY9WTI5_9BACT|nr:cytochrome P450 [Archangium minus]